MGSTGTTERADPRADHCSRPSRRGTQPAGASPPSNIAHAVDAGLGRGLTLQGIRRAVWAHSEATASRHAPTIEMCFRTYAFRLDLRPEMLQAVTGSGEHLAVLLAAQGVGLHPGRRCHQVDGQVQTGGVEELLPIVVSAEEGLPIQPSGLDLLGGAGVIDPGPRRVRGRTKCKVPKVPMSRVTKGGSRRQASEGGPGRPGDEQAD